MGEQAVDRARWACQPRAARAARARKRPLVSMQPVGAASGDGWQRTPAHVPAGHLQGKVIRGLIGHNGLRASATNRELSVSSGGIEGGCAGDGWVGDNSQAKETDGVAWRSVRQG